MRSTSATTEADLSTLQQMGFNRVILDRLNLAEPADAMGLEVVLACFWDRATTWSEVAFVLQVAASLSRPPSINMMDEPNDNGLDSHAPDVYRRLRRLIREAGSDVSLSLTIYGPKPGWPPSWSWMFLDYLDAIDLLRIDPYPYVAQKPLDLVSEWIERSATLSRHVGRDLPLTVVLQTWSDGRGLPPIAAIRVMAYVALLSGVQALSFFDYNPVVWNAEPGFTDGFAALMQELTTLAQEFAGARVVGLLGGDGFFQAEAERAGEFTQFTINTRDGPNGRFAPWQIVREPGRCRRPLAEPHPPSSPLARLQALRRRAATPRD